MLKPFLFISLAFLLFTGCETTADYESNTETEIFNLLTSNDWEVYRVHINDEDITDNISITYKFTTDQDVLINDNGQVSVQNFSIYVEAGYSVVYFSNFNQGNYELLHYSEDEIVWMFEMGDDFHVQYLQPKG